MTAASQLTLAEQLYLLAYDDVGALRANPWSFKPGLAGAVLLELSLKELVRERPDGNVAVVERPGEVPSLLKDAMTAIRATERSMDRWVYGLESKLKPIKKTVARSLVERGVLAEKLGLIAWTRFPTVDPAPRSELVERVHAFLLSAPRPDPTGPGMIQTRPRDPSEEENQLRMLLGLLNLIRPLVPRDRRKQAIRRSDQIAEGNPPLSAAQAAVCTALSLGGAGTSVSIS